MNKLLAVLLSLLGCTGAIACIAMTVVAADFMELGRVVFYMTLSIICIGIAIWGISSLLPKKQ